MEAGSSVALEVVGKRWVRCGVLNAVVAAAVWLMWELVTLQGTWGSVLGAATRFVIFQLAQALFLLGQKVVVQPEDPSLVSMGDMLVGMLSLAWRAALGGPLEGESAVQAYFLVQKIRATRDRIILCLLGIASGFLSLSSLTSSVKSVLGSSFTFDMGIRGAALWLCYFALYLRGRRYLLRFPIIQRRVYFSFKLGLPAAVSSALRIAVISVPIGEMLVRLLHFYLAGDWGSSFSLWHQLVFLIGAFFSTFSWNVCSHLIQVIHTRRHVFAPAPGSAAAETNPTEPLLTVLEEEDNLLLQYLGFLDLSIISGVSEMNVEAWRRAAFFEESGDTYKKVISVCLRPLDRLTMNLVKGLANMQTGHVEKNQMLSEQSLEIVSAKESFQDFQLCSWCAGIVSSLTAFSRTEDRYGIAQLSGCNGAVLSSLISCLLVVEVYLGRRSSFQALSFVGPNGIKWAVPFRGAFMDADRRQSLLFRRKSLLHKRAHAMADVLRTAIYRIVSVFKEEMVIAGSGASACAIAERDWLSRLSKPVFGTPEIHLQKLGQFLEFHE